MGSFRLRNFLLASLLCLMPAATWAQFGGPKPLRLGPDKFLLPDTTLSTSASGKKVIVGDLTDPAVMWDLAAFRAAERNTSYYRAGEGTFPTRYAVTITTGADSVVIWSRDDWSRWMVFKIGAAAYLYSGAVLSDVHFLDGILSITDASGGNALVRVDFVRDRAWRHSTSGILDLSTGISGRNTGATYTVTASSPAIVNANVNAVAAICDPFGLQMKDGSGRLAQWWVVGTAVNTSVYNPHTNAIYDNAAGLVERDVVLLPNGSLLKAARVGLVRSVYRWKANITSVTADSWSDVVPGGSWINNASGALDIAWGDPASSSRIAGLPGRSAAGNNAPLAIAGADSGLYLLHCKPPTGTTNEDMGGKVLIEDGFNAPYAVGYAVGVYPLESAGTDVSPYVNSLTAVGTPGYAAAVFGSGYSSTSDSYLKRENDSDYNDPRSVHCWFKTKSATNPSGNEGLITLRDEVGATDDAFVFYLTSSGYLNSFVSDGAATDAGTASIDVYDGLWHHGAMVLRTASVDVYLDGELHNQDASLTVTLGNIDTDSLAVGALHTSGVYDSYFNGLIDQAVVSKNELTAAEIRGIYRDGLLAIQSAVDPSDAIHATDVDYVDAWEDWALAGDEDSCTVFQVGSTTLIPWRRYGSPGGNIQDAALIPIPGADSVGVMLVTTTRVQAIQPDPRVADYASYVWPYVQPFVGEEVVVDSAGAAGIFWHGDDAVDAAANAGVGNVLFRKGTYPPFDADQTNIVIRGAGRTSIIDGSTTDDAIDASAADVTIADLAVQTTAGGGNAFDGIEVSARVNVHNVTGVASDNVFINITGTGDDSKITDNRNISSDAQGVLIDIDAENCIVDGNRLDGWGTAGITDNSGTSTSGDNDVD